MNKPVLAIHGGAGTIRREEMNADREAAYRAGLGRALDQGWTVLREGGDALDTVERAVRTLEDDPLFNAGRGAVFTHEGTHEMDACMMSGRDLRAGAVACVGGVRNPVSLARLVMERTEHVLLCGAGAEEFARAAGVGFETPEYFFDQFRFDQLTRARAEGAVRLDHSAPIKERKFGTVGAVARDAQGHIAAATSTGGMTNKRYGRIGDTPIIGAGTYADDRTCAVSCTGHGEFFMRHVAAYTVACLMKYSKLDVATASRRVVEELREAGGEGGLIAIGASGEPVLEFNSAGMYRGWIGIDGESRVEIYRD